MLLALSVFAAGGHASTETTIWDFSEWYGDATSEVTLSETTTKSGLTVYASSETAVKFDASKKTVDGISCTHRLKFGGKGNETTGRYVTFNVAKNSTIKIVADHASGSGDPRPLKIALNLFSNVVNTTDLLPGSPQVVTYNYTGTENATVYLYSGNSGINLRKIIVETTTEEQQEDPVNPASGISTIVTLRNNPVMKTHAGVATHNWNVAVRNASNDVIVPLDPSSEVQVTFSNPSVASLNHLASTQRSGFVIVMNINGVGTTDVTVKYNGGTYNGVTYEGSQETFTLVVTPARFSSNYEVIDWHSYPGIVSGRSYYDGWTTDPAEGKFSFISPGYIEGGDVITEVPGITMTVGAPGDTWSVVAVNNLDGQYNLGAAAAYCPDGAVRPACTSGCFVDFNPIVNGYLTVHFYKASGDTYLYQNGNEQLNRYGNRIQTQTILLKAGERYSLAGKESGFYLESFSFRPVFLAPLDYNDVQPVTLTFDATVATTAYPKVLTQTHELVSHWADRSVAAVGTTGDVTIAATGWTVVGANAYMPGNSERKLTALYTLGTTALNLVSTTPANDALVESVDGNVVKFIFDQDVSLTNNYKAIVIVNGEIHEYTSDHVAVEPSNSKQVNVSLDNSFVSGGQTITVILAQGSVASTSNVQLLNAEETVSFNINGDDPAVTMVYPSNPNAASVGTAIALQLTKGNTTDLKSLEENAVKAIITAAGEDPMEVYASMTLHNQYIFKPIRTLRPSTQYTIFVEGGQMVMGNGATVTSDKAFTFTTGTVAGEAPVLVASFPVDGQILSSANYASGTFTLTFDQNIRLEPYTEITSTPVNGSESLVDGNNYLDASNPSLTVSSNNPNQIQFSYANPDNGLRDYLKWDVLQEIVLPANSVTAPGGMPNTEPIVVKFRMPKNPNARDITLDYMDGTKPFTWDFNNFGCLTGTYDDIHNAIDANTVTNDKTLYSIFKVDGSNLVLRGHRDNPNKFVQGSEFFFMKYGDTQKYYMDEFKGIRVSIKNIDQNNRVHIIDTKEYGKSQLRFIGNTHYITIPNVPAGTKVYIKAKPNRPLKDNYDNPYSSGGRFAINSQNAKFLTNYDPIFGDEYAYLDDKKEKTYVLQMDPDGCAQWGNDLSFCISDFYLSKIAISVDSKTLTPYASKAYATDCQPYPVEYKLTNDFGQGSITGMYILSSDNQGVNSASTSISSKDVTYAAGTVRTDEVLEGTIVKADAPAPDGSYTFPYFTTDVNTQPDELYEDLVDMKNNMLVGVLEDTPLTREVESGTEMAYVFTASRYITDQSGNLSYMEPKHLKNWNGNQPTQVGDKYYIYDTNEKEYEVVLENGKYYLVDEQGNKIPRTASYSNPTFQPVLAYGDGIDTGNLDTGKLWTLTANSSYLLLTKAASVNDNILLDEVIAEELDAIETIAVSNGVRLETNGWYTLYGVKLAGAPTEKGVYIYNNKKVLIK